MDDAMHQCPDDWAGFMGRIASMLATGCTDSDISKAFSGATVRWKGKVLEKKLSERFACGVSLEMSPARVLLGGGRVLRGDYLFANVSSVHLDEWGLVPVGSDVEFEATISSANGSFREVTISAMDDDPEMILMVGCYEARLA